MVCNMDLSPKQARFVEEYLKDSNGTQAAIRAGYSEKTANEQASRLLTKVSVKTALEKRMAEIAERTNVTVERHLEKLAELRDAAFANNQLSAAIQAEVKRGEAVGLYVVRKMVDAKVNEPARLIING